MFVIIQELDWYTIYLMKKRNNGLVQSLTCHNDTEKHTNTKAHTPHAITTKASLRVTLDDYHTPTTKHHLLHTVRRIYQRKRRTKTWG